MHLPSSTWWSVWLRPTLPNCDNNYVLSCANTRACFRTLCVHPSIMNAVNSAFIQSIIRHLVVCLAMGAGVLPAAPLCSPLPLLHMDQLLYECFPWIHATITGNCEPKHTHSQFDIWFTQLWNTHNTMCFCVYILDIATYLPLSTYLLAAFKECWTKVDKYRNIPCRVGQCSSNNGLPQQNCATMKVFCLRGRKQQISGDFVIRRGSDPFKCVGGASQRSSGISWIDWRSRLSWASLAF